MKISKLTTDGQKHSANIDSVFHNVLRVGALVVLVIWIIESNAGLTQHFDHIGYSLTLLTTLAAYLLSYRFGQVNAAKVIIFAYAALYLMTLAVLGFLQAAKEGTLYSIASTLQWVPIIYILAFLFLETRPALVGALCVYLSLVLMLVLTYSGMLPIRNPDLRILMVNMALSHGLYIMCMFAVVQLKTTYREQSDMARRMEQAANLDSLLNIANRRFLQSLMDKLEKHKTAVSILLIDVDRFKSINDSYGHAEGDAVLKRVVAQIQRSLRSVDVLGRWGGEEFLILADVTHNEDALSLARRICADVQHQLKEHTPPVTISIGVAEYEGKGEIESIIIQGDKALYQAKQQGRNRAVLYTSNNP